MIYTENTKKAIKLMYEKHQNQVDKSGMPYVFHPWHVAEEMTNENATIVALLHDIVEDTDVTLEQLINMGFNNEVVEAISCMTHREGEEYLDYVNRLSANSIARKVKLADLKHNMDYTRLDNVSEKDLAKLEKYKISYELLSSIEREEKMNNSQGKGL